MECTILPYLNSIAEQQAYTTQNTEAAITYFLDYSATNINTVVKFGASDMVLHIDSDASYLSKPWECSHTGCHYYLSSQPSDPTKSPHLPPQENVPIQTECIILRDVVSSSAEEEVCGIFHNRKTDVPLCITLSDIGFPQSPTPIKTDKSVAEGMVTATFRQKRSKAMDMIFYLMKDRVKQKDLFVYWKPGSQKHGGLLHKTSTTTSP